MYNLPTTNLQIRCIDGHFEYVNPAHYSRYTPGTAAHWQAILNAPGCEAPRADVLAKLAASGSLSTYCRAVARTLYSVPDEVELYQPGDFDVNL